MTSLSVAAEPLWKYGARAASPRRIGPLNLPMSLHLPLISARPRSVVCTVSPLLQLTVYSGRSGVRREPSATPMFSGPATLWSPTLGVLWQVEQAPVTTGSPSASFSPFTPLLEIGRRLKMASLRGNGARRATELVFHAE